MPLVAGIHNKRQSLDKQISMPHKVDFDRFNFDSKDIPLSANRLLSEFKPLPTAKPACSRLNSRSKLKTRSVGFRGNSFSRKNSNQGCYVLTVNRVHKN